MVDLQVLGSLDLRGVDPTAAQAILGQPRPTALFVYLVMARPGAFLRRDHLVGLFWAETDQEHARSNLRKLVSILRGHLGDDLIEARGDEELRVPSGRVRCDALEFDESMRAGRFARAMELYTGPLLAGFNLSGAREFELWLALSRRSMARDAVKATLSLAQLYVDDAELTRAGDVIQLVTRLARELDDEHQLRKLLTLLDRLGDRATAIRVYEDFKTRVWDDLQTLPSPETRSLVEAIKTR